MSQVKRVSKGAVFFKNRWEKQTMPRKALFLWTRNFTNPRLTLVRFFCLFLFLFFFMNKRECCFSQKLFKVAQNVHIRPSLSWRRLPFRYSAFFQRLLVLPPTVARRISGRLADLRVHSYYASVPASSRPMLASLHKGRPK